jgi:hypothetical protein
MLGRGEPGVRLAAAGENLYIVQGSGAVLDLFALRIENGK